MREYIIPNWHAILIHAPLGLLTTGLILEILTLLWRRSSARAAARWMILLGAITAAPALTSGIYAYHDVISPTTLTDEGFQDRWSDLMDSPVEDRIPEARSATDDKVREITAGEMLKGETGTVLRQHMWMNSLGLGGAFLVVVIFIGCSDNWRRKLYIPLLLGLIASQGAIIFGAHNGGLAVYQQGAAIQPIVYSPPGGPTVQPTLHETIKRYLPPAQVHFTMAGWVVGLALVALGLSIRAMTQGDPLPAGAAADEEWFETQQARTASPGPRAPTYQASDDAEAGIRDREPTPFGVVDPEPAAVTEERREISRPLGYRGTAVTTVRTTTASTAIVVPVPVVPAGRFWLLTLLAAVLTFTGGLWLINCWTWQSLMAYFHGENRNRYHIILGTSIVALTLILAFLARFARRAKWMLATFAFLLFAAVALQIYVGVLLAFDSPKGPSNPSAIKGLMAPLHWWPAEGKSKAD